MLAANAFFGFGATVAVCCFPPTTAVGTFRASTTAEARTVTVTFVVAVAPLTFNRLLAVGAINEDMREVVEPTEELTEPRRDMPAPTPVDDDGRALLLPRSMLFMTSSTAAIEASREGAVASFKRVLPKATIVEPLRAIAWGLDGVPGTETDPAAETLRRPAPAIDGRIDAPVTDAREEEEQTLPGLL